MSRKSVARFGTAGLASVALLVACQAAAPTPSPSATVAPPAGGTLRVVMPRDVEEIFSTIVFPPQDPGAPPVPPALDPHLVSWGDSAELLRCCLARTLLSTNGRSADEHGAILRPDLASALPTISTDGLRWTFELKKGVHYGPPLQSVEITSADFVRTFERMFKPEVIEAGAFEADLFTDIVGATEFREGRASSISGLETPDSHTLVIRALRPSGDLGARLANPWAAPIPPNPHQPAARLGIAEGHDDGYGSFLVSSGPYMVEGSEALDFSLPPEQQPPLAGLRPGESVVLVRNPAWDRATDDLRPAHPDRIEIHAAASVGDAAAEIEDGRADLLLNLVIAPQIPRDIVDAFERGDRLGQLFINEFDAIRGVTMNTAQPPFDDIHVRRAVAYVVNRARVIELQGGPYAYRVARHLAPEVLLDNLLVDYRPFASPGDMGDLEAARAEMRQSAYDTDGDGACDAAACREAVAISRPELAAIGSSIVEDLARIGILLQHDVVDPGEFFDAANDPARHVALFPAIGWAKGYISASDFFVGRFYSPSALGADFGNTTMVGASAEQLAGWGYETREVPNVDERIEACLPLVGAAQFECWAGFDQYMTESVVAVVPLSAELVTAVGSNRITGYAFDQLVAMPAFDQIRVAQ